jgi:hypothetical protein
LPIVFATTGFSVLLKNWLTHACAAGVTRPLVIAMDDLLAESLAGAGIKAIRHGFDGTLADFWLQRTLIFEALANQGIDFIHSDVDAVWLKDPRPFCFADGGFDLVFSQGTTHPVEIWRKWGFVLCCGLFAARARPATAAFFSSVRSLAARVGDDQVVVNFLLEQNGLTWSTEGVASYELTVRTQIFTCYRQMLEGASDRLGLRVGMLPHHLVPRLPVAAPDALVKHPLGPAGASAKEPILRAAGCWMPVQT